MSKRPQAVTRAAELAEERFNEAYSQEEGQAPEEQQPEEQQQQPEEQQPEAKPEEKPEEKPQAENWEQRYRSLKGKYDAEIPRLTARARTLERDLVEYEQRIEELEQAAKSAAVKQETKSLVSDEEKEEYGEEFTAFIERIAKKAAQGDTANLTTQAPKPANEVQPRTPPSGQTVYQTLDAQVPDWRSINKDPEFLGWLQVEDPLSGNTRHHMLSQAFGAGDASRVLAFFNQYIQQERSYAAPQPQQEQPAPEPAPKGKLKMEDLAGPRQGAPSAQPREPEKEKIWTGKEIAAFYADVQKGHYKAKPDEKAKIEAAVGKALAEGRVQPS